MNCSLFDIKSNYRMLIKNSEKPVRICLPKTNKYCIYPNMVTASTGYKNQIDQIHEFCIKLMCNIPDEMIPSIRKSLRITLTECVKGLTNTLLSLNSEHCILKFNSNYLSIKMLNLNFASPLSTRADVLTIMSNVNTLFKKTISISFEHQGRSSYFYNEIVLIANNKLNTNFVKNGWLNDPVKVRSLFQGLEKFDYCFNYISPNTVLEWVSSDDSSTESDVENVEDRDPKIVEDWRMDLDFLPTQEALLVEANEKFCQDVYAEPTKQVENLGWENSWTRNKEPSDSLLDF